MQLVERLSKNYQRPVLRLLLTTIPYYLVKPVLGGSWGSATPGHVSNCAVRGAPSVTYLSRCFEEQVAELGAHRVMRALRARVSSGQDLGDGVWPVLAALLPRTAEIEVAGHPQPAPQPSRHAITSAWLCCSLDC